MLHLPDCGGTILLISGLRGSCDKSQLYWAVFLGGDVWAISVLQCSNDPKVNQNRILVIAIWGVRGGDLPVHYLKKLQDNANIMFLERVTRIELVTEAWEAFVIPFHHTRITASAIR